MRITLKILLPCFVFSLLPMWASSQQKAQILMNPKITDVAYDSSPIVFSAVVTGFSGPQFTWTLDGPGVLNNTHQQAITYTPPTAAQGNCQPALATISVSITDSTGATTTVAITLNIVPLTINEPAGIVPPNGDPTAITVKGIYSNNCIQDDLWVFICPSGDGRCWPQASSREGTPAVKDVDGTWSTEAALGGTPPKIYTIIAYTAAPAVSQQITNFMRDCIQQGNHVGVSTSALSTQFGTLTERARIRVEKPNADR